MRIVASMDRWQRRHAVGGFPFAVLKKFGEDRASSLAALIAYYAFVSLFPLLLAFVSILGFVLDDNPSLRADVVDTVLARIPVLGAELRGDVQPLTGSGIALAVGLVGALWAGLGVTVALGRAFAEIWDTPRVEQPRRPQDARAGSPAPRDPGSDIRHLHGRSGAGAGRPDRAGRRARCGGRRRAGGQRRGVPHRVRAPDTRPATGAQPVARRRRWRPVGALILQSLGGWYVDHAVADASAVYGTFALVIGLLSWFWLSAHLLLVAAEVNVVLRWQLWPRSMAGELEPADQLALRRYAEAARHDAREQIAVSFRDDEG